MKAIKVNADYEAVLFTNKKSLPVINESLEFLAFFIDDRPILSHKTYDANYLSYVEEVTGRKPKIVKGGDFENWWGELKDIELEKKLNSKEMSAELTIKEGWCTDTHILSSLSDLPDLSSGKTYLAKNPYGMSGQNFCMVSEGRLDNLNAMLKSGKVILEPFFDRVYDFSHYIYPDGKKICYQNVVDKKFQYKGTCFSNANDPELSQLEFYSEIERAEWDKFELALNKIIQHYQERGKSLRSGFSVDSFVYEEEGKLKIRFLSEVNYRKTMGYVAHELAEKFSYDCPWTSFMLSKSSKKTFKEMKQLLIPYENIMLLSPGDTRYDMFFLKARDAKEGAQLMKVLKTLLPSAEFSIDF